MFITHKQQLVIVHDVTAVKMDSLALQRKIWQWHDMTEILSYRHQ